MKKMMVILFALFLSFSAYAQSADVITDILETEKVTFGQASYITAVQLNLVGEKASFEESVNALYEKGFIQKRVESDSPISALELAFFYSKLWNIKGGLMFRLTKGSPRYVYKQFQADGVISLDLDPSSNISGAKALSIYTACVNKYSDFDISSVSMGAE